jgi:hypothetical protein
LADAILTPTREPSLLSSQVQQGPGHLPVDIDINYVGHGDLDAMRAARPAFEAALAACCEREDCVVRRSPTEHAGGKFRLR